jgi:RNA polymerase sigma-70 factor (ECF subfamily)
MPANRSSVIMEVSDETILQQFAVASTREAAFNVLVRKYQERLYWHIRRMVIVHEDADDVVQNVFVKVWTGLDGFRGEAQLFTWLYRIATNEAITFLSQRRKKQAYSMDDEQSSVANRLRADRFFDGDDLQVRLQEAIALLPDKQKLVFNLRYYDEMKYEDMSEVLGTSVGALKASYHHAVKKIEKHITKD